MHLKLFLVALGACLALASCENQTAKSQRDKFNSFTWGKSWRFTSAQLYDQMAESYEWFAPDATGRDIAEKLLLIGETNGCDKRVLEALAEFQGRDIRYPGCDLERVLKFAVERATLTGECRAAAKALYASQRKN